MKTLERFIMEGRHLSAVQRAALIYQKGDIVECVATGRRFRVEDFREIPSAYCANPRLYSELNLDVSRCIIGDRRNHIYENLNLDGPLLPVKGSAEGRRDGYLFFPFCGKWPWLAPIVNPQSPRSYLFDPESEDEGEIEGDPMLPAYGFNVDFMRFLVETGDLPANLQTEFEDRIREADFFTNFKAGYGV